MKLEFKNVTKQYGEVNAVNKVNCVMEKGIYGLLGVNGAGKTTLLTCISGLMSYKGSITYNGQTLNSKITPDQIVKLGIVQVPEGRSSGIFTTGFWILSRFDRI